MKVKKESRTTLTCIEVHGINSGTPEHALKDIKNAGHSPIHQTVEDKHFRVFQKACPD